MRWGLQKTFFFSKKDTQMANRHMKKFSISVHIKEIQIKITMKYLFTPVRIAIIKTTTTRNNK